MDRRTPEEDYELLSSDPDSRGNNAGSASRRRSTQRGRFHACFHCFTLRRILIGFALIPFLLIIVVLWSGIPPSYADIRTYERLLPQHNLTEAAEKGVMYLRFPGHLWGHGLNNILQET
jgi:hypothetical protein